MRDWPEFCRAARRWLLETATRLGADSGFVTYAIDAVQPCDDPAVVDRSGVAALRELLEPVLPVGRRTVDDYFAPPDNPYEVRPPYVV